MEKRVLPRVTPYYPHHVARGAKMMEKGGWIRPFVFTDPYEEVINTRQNAGLIDAHSMGKFRVVGRDAFSFLQYVMTNDLSKISEGRGIYTCFCSETGGIVDDVIVYWISNAEFYFITNTLSRERVGQWLATVKTTSKFDVHVFDETNTTGYLAIQGPRSAALMAALFGEDVLHLKYFDFYNTHLNNVATMVARTGYTGEFGYELIFPSEFGYSIWGYLLEIGENYGLRPVGGNAIQILRTEKSYRAHGTDMDVATNPYEMGLGWTVALKKDNFLGKDALLKIKTEGTTREFAGFEIHGDITTITKGTRLTVKGTPAGYLTTCYFSPTLDKNLAMGFRDREYDDIVEFTVDGVKDTTAHLHRMPFFDPKGSRLKTAPNTVAGLSL